MTLWDAAADVMYWAVVQDQADSAGRGVTRHARIVLHQDDILDKEGLRRILAKTKIRFARLEQERHGAEVLIKLLEEKLKVHIDYDPQAGIPLITNSSGEPYSSVRRNPWLAE